MVQRIRVKDALQTYSTQLEVAGVPSAQASAYAIFAHVLGVLADNVGQYLNVELTKKQLLEIEDMIARRKRREPLARIFGGRVFYGLKIKVADGVFRPCLDVEHTVEQALLQFEDKRSEPLRILDLGTGSGCVLLALLSKLPKATGVGVDLSEVAIDLARENAALNGLEARATFQKGNWGAGLKEQFDLIISNPPAIKSRHMQQLAPELRDYDPLLALEGGRDGLASYRAIAKDFKRLIKISGLGVFHAYTFDDEAELFRVKGFHVETKLNYLYAPYCIIVKGECMRRGGLSSLLKINIKLWNK